MWGKSKKTWNVPFVLWFFGKQTDRYGFWVVPAFPLSFSLPRCLVAGKMKKRERKPTTLINLYVVSSFCFRENGKSNVAS